MLVGRSLLREERDVEATDCQVALARGRRSKRNCRGKSLLREEDDSEAKLSGKSLLREENDVEAIDC